MSATDYPPRCKDKKNLANDVHCELYFLQKYAKNLNTSRFSFDFLSKTCDNVTDKQKRSQRGLPLLPYSIHHACSVHDMRQQ